MLTDSLQRKDSSLSVDPCPAMGFSPTRSCQAQCAQNSADPTRTWGALNGDDSGNAEEGPQAGPVSQA